MVVSKMKILENQINLLLNGYILSNQYDKNLRNEIVGFPLSRM